MLAAVGKLKSNSDFNYLYRVGRRITGPAFSVCYTASKTVGPTKFGVVASIKQVGKAVKRNRARRRLWQAINKHQALFPRERYLISFILKQPIITLTWPKLMAMVEQAARRLR